MVHCLAVEKAESIVDIFNTFCELETVKSSLYFKFVFYINPIVAAIIPVLYGFAVLLIGMDPITSNPAFQLNNWTKLKYILRILMPTFEIWNFTVLSSVGLLLVHEGMLFSYIALYEIALEWYKKTLDPYQTFSFRYTKLKCLVASYYKLKIYTLRENDCYQTTFAVRYKPILLIVSISLATVMLSQKLRSTTSSIGLFFCVFTVSNCYIFMALAYYFPGKVNEYSKRTLAVYSRFIAANQIDTGNGNSAKKGRKIIYACRDVRVYIGDTNYYEKLTALNILDFLVEQTIRTVLLFYPNNL